MTAPASAETATTVARTWAVALTGLAGHMVEVEADLSSQTPEFHLIGLTDRALSEAVRRVHNACKNSGLDLPRRRLTVNLSPASLPKHGSGFDLAIATAALATEGTLDPASVQSTVHIGELGLDGRLRPVSGVLPALHAARRAGYRRAIVPHANAAEADLVPEMRVDAAASLRQVALLHGADLEPVDVEAVGGFDTEPPPAQIADLADVVGQDEAVEALLVAAAGGHHMLLSGPPGAGKTMLAARMPGILPPLDDEAALEAAAIRSLAGETVSSLRRDAPLVSPHHSSSVAALVGGGSRAARPGAIVRAHRGILFLDEAAEFSRVALDALRQPLESGSIQIHRAGFTATFPARFQLLLATNPCPCGSFGVVGEECTCPPSAIRRYSARLSGPLRDRLDIDVRVARVASAAIADDARGSISTADAQRRVAMARARAASRWEGTPWRVNADVPGSALRQGSWRLPVADRAVLDRALQRGALTLRGYDRVLRLAWSIADLEDIDRPGSDQIGRALFLKKGLSA